MEHIDDLPESEKKHYEQCTCGVWFDCRDLGQVFNHLHITSALDVEWSFSVRKGEPVAYARSGKRIDLN